MFNMFNSKLLVYQRVPPFYHQSQPNRFSQVSPTNAPPAPSARCPAAVADGVALPRGWRGRWYPIPTAEWESKKPPKFGIEIDEIDEINTLTCNLMDICPMNIYIQCIYIYIQCIYIYTMYIYIYNVYIYMLPRATLSEPAMWVPIIFRQSSHIF